MRYFRENKHVHSDLRDLQHYFQKKIDLSLLPALHWPSLTKQVTKPGNSLLISESVPPYKNSRLHTSPLPRYTTFQKRHIFTLHGLSAFSLTPCDAQTTQLPLSNDFGNYIGSIYTSKYTFCKLCDSLPKNLGLPRLNLPPPSKFGFFHTSTLMAVSKQIL